MREYGKIKTSFWAAPKVRALSEQARLLLLYLYACPHGNAIGCFLLPIGYVSEDMEWPAKHVSELLSELGSKGFIERDDGTRLTRIRSWWEHNTVENRNVARGIVKILSALPRCGVLANAVADLRAKAVGNEFLTAVQTEFPNAVTNKEAIPEPEPEPEPESGAPTRRVDDQVFETLWKAYPHRGSHADPKKPARERFVRIVQAGTDPETIIAAATRYAATMRGKDPQHVAQLVTWLNQARWEQYEAGSETAGGAAIGENPVEKRMACLERLLADDRWYLHYGPKPTPDEARAELGGLREKLENLEAA